MLIPLNDIILIYQKIIQQLNLDYVSVIVFTGVDIDSLCSLKILTKLFKTESIHHQIYPVTTYTQLEARIQQTKQYQKVKLFMFINCGGFIDLTQKWFLNQTHDQAKVFLFDVNKPINHKNLQSPSILIIDDQHSDLDNRITSQQMNKLQQLNDFDLDQQAVESDEQQSEQNSPKRHAHTQLNIRLKKHKLHLQRKLFNYYGNTFLSLPTSYCLYRLVRELNKAENYVLWYAIVGMTSMYLENYMPKQILQNLTQLYRTDMIKFNAQNSEKREKGEIFTKKGYQFPLMNHWSLYESMIHSSYLNINIGLWNDKGLNRLHEILTKLGISLQQAKQQYKYMTKDLKDCLEENMFMIAEYYKLTEITYESFMKQTDSSSSFMASDFYYLITAILEKPIYKSTSEQLSEHRLDCFWQAYSLLDGSQQMIKGAVQQFKQMAKIFMKQAKDIIQRDNIIAIQRINFSNIRCDTKQKRTFQHPSALNRLAHMLMGIQKQRKSIGKKNNVSAIPYIISLQDVDKQTCQILGVTPELKNDMGTRFNNTIIKLNITDASHDRFMSNVIIIPKDNLLDFIKEIGKIQNQ